MRITFCGIPTATQITYTSRAIKILLSLTARLILMIHCLKEMVFFYNKIKIVLYFLTIFSCSTSWSIIHDFQHINSVCISNAAGSINISNILTGKCLAKIRASNSFPTENECNCSSNCCGSSCSLKKQTPASRIRSSSCSLKRQTPASRIRSTVAEALEDITALFYDEERNEIYTGNRHGLVHVWSN